MTQTARLIALALLVGTASGALAEGRAAFEWFEYRGHDAMHEEPLEPGQYRNPVIAGYYPDPSIVRVGEDYYLVNSSFAHWPGLPVFHSRDLVRWRQLGHALERRSQLTFENGQGISRGIFAPTIRYHDGLFYIITTDVDGIGNFIVTAEDPAGPWSEPVRLPEIDGIDPDLFFDDDGRAWIVHNAAPDGGARYPGHRAIRLWAFDVENLRVIDGGGRVLVDGGVDISQQPQWVEGPHLYKVDGWYYLSCAEGGTGDQHSQVVFRARSLDDAFVPWSRNPILTQHDLDPDRPDPVTSVGHADFVQTPAGDWWAVFLGVRPWDGVHHNTGRETFLLPVHWPKGGWPRILDRGEPVPLRLEAPALPAWDETVPPQSGNFDWRDDFAGPRPALNWVMVRSGPESWLTFERDRAVLRALPTRLTEKRQPAFLGRRQQHLEFSASTDLALPLDADVAAGLALFHSADFNLFLGVREADGQPQLFLEKAEGGQVSELGSAILPSGLQGVVLGVEQRRGELDFFYRAGEGARTWLARGVDAGLLSTQRAGGFVGTLVGIHARSETP